MCLIWNLHYSHLVQMNIYSKGSKSNGPVICDLRLEWMMNFLTYLFRVLITKYYSLFWVLYNFTSAREIIKNFYNSHYYFWERIVYIVSIILMPFIIWCEWQNLFIILKIIVQISVRFSLTHEEKRWIKMFASFFLHCILKFGLWPIQAPHNVPWFLKKLT